MFLLASMTVRKRHFLIPDLAFCNFGCFLLLFSALDLVAYFTPCFLKTRSTDVNFADFLYGLLKFWEDFMTS
jgi:hypothetical protein